MGSDLGTCMLGEARAQTSKMVFIGIDFAQRHFPTSMDQSGVSSAPEICK
jgi:hypothetical protein